MQETKDYQTKQRNVIMEFFQKNSARCYNANELYAELLKMGESVGKTTVYRTLENLTQKGLLLTFPSQDKNGAVYQFKTKKCEEQDHIHLKCNICGKLFHLDCAIVEEFGLHLFEQHNFCIDREKTVIYGECKHCSDKRKSK
ncbi:MAG: transcriptional repressor [Oscillospiraceae bacterium]